MAELASKTVSTLQWEVVLAVTKPTMDCLRQSEFSGMDGEIVQEVHAMAHLTNSNSFSLQDAQYAVRVPRHFWQVNYLACAWATVVAFALHVFVITFKIHKLTQRRN